MAKTQGDHTVKGILTADGNTKLNKGLDSPYLEIVDSKARGIASGGFTGKSSGEHSWRTRDLTATLFNDFATSVTLAASAGDGGDITLEKGVYYIEASCPALSVDEHTARLADVTDNPGASGSTVVLGTSEYAADANLWRDVHGTEMTVSSSSQTRSFITGKFQLTSQRTLEIQHQCNRTQATNGFGSDGNFYITPNVFTVVKMWQVRNDQ